jgi:hypothetical protein
MKNGEGFWVKEEFGDGGNLDNGIFDRERREILTGGNRDKGAARKYVRPT